MRGAGWAVGRGRARPAGRIGVLAAVALALGLLAAACGGGDATGGDATSGDAGSELTASTPCAEWLAASPEEKAAALAPGRAYTEGGINAYIVETRRVWREGVPGAEPVPDEIPVAEGLTEVDQACASVLGDDKVGQAIPAYETQVAPPPGSGVTAAP